ncbi:recombination mediator RecR [Taylorella equigenitalis]|uniref:Recombination protein RecR n=2 Tax=Taylorella equigenitalis TaxID=29575 RepID=A0A654KFI4_TAYEM|nr:recombination mediator RecR [Taylorella equigenitalis]ADU91193.1 Recombination protein RecR [Taylorella equigenitalis MCE9]AFN36297.1 recombination protein RecR [Taylorella equigenitalis ATCC 35865]ASY30869.1 recombination protein RecR [Taylorella equigenitalis]ASY38173.1 recombination protein RecR [Taylorella equigenitalis]ASY39697.1 recombination protein RecR [Taylorella equigenitalis]
MTQEPEPLQALIESISGLPGIGVRTARRLAYHMLQNDREGAEYLAHNIKSALITLKHCSKCNNFSSSDICDICSSNKRDLTTLCIVETPADLIRIEESHGYRGLYYVLMGRITPMSPKGAQGLNFEHLIERVKESGIKEVIIATNFTTEGETTAHFIKTLFSDLDIQTSRIARGVPSGSELEYVDAATIAWALNDRKK